MSDQLATDIRAIVDDGAPPITLAELELAAVDATPLRPRRRWPVLAAAAVVVILITAGVLVAATRHDAPNVRTPAGRPPAPTAPVPLSAPLVQGPDAASTLLTSWGQHYVGYVLVYADGRVLIHYDSCCESYPPERHLSARGLELVYSGELDAQDILVGPMPYWREGLWVEPTGESWEPTTYALCPYRPVAGGGVSVDASDIVDELPAPVRAMLDGKQRAYQPSLGTAHWPFPGTAQTGMTDCFELTAAETSTLYQIIEANGFVGQDPITGAQGWTRVFHYGSVAFAPEPVFPHGQYVLWGA